MNNFSKPILLMGMMGSGKSALGDFCAHKAGLSFFDSDAYVEEQAGMPIAHIFEQHGEESFRELERAAVAELLGRGPCFIATGGGAVLNEDTRALIKERTVSVWLDVDIDVLHARLSGDTHRPLLQSDNPYKVLRDLLEVRRPYYAQADIALKISEETLSETAQILLEQVSEFIKE